MASSNGKRTRISRSVSSPPALGIANKKEEHSKPPYKFMDPELLMVARNGNYNELENLLNNQNHIIIPIMPEANSNQPVPEDSTPGEAVQEGTNQVGSNVLAVAFLGCSGCCARWPRKSRAQPPGNSSAEESTIQPSDGGAEEASNPPGDGATQPEVANPPGGSDAAEASNQTVNATEEAGNPSGDSAAEETARRQDPVMLLDGVTFDSEEDSALHVVATAGDSEDYLKCAEIIYGKAKHLLHAPNKKRETPLHRAATAGNLSMVSRMMEMAARDNRGVAGLKELLRKPNTAGERVLHNAIRSGKW